jgi:hypothetical protein
LGSKPATDGGCGTERTRFTLGLKAGILSLKKIKRVFATCLGARELLPPDKKYQIV